MIQLRLFRATAPFEPIDECSLDAGELVIGRDPSAHWMIPDESCELSRRHCTISLRDGCAVLRDTSSNGVFLGDDRRRAPHDSEVALGTFETLHLGQFLIVLEPREDAPANDGAAFRGLFQTVVPPEALQVRSDWDVDPESAANDGRPLTDAALLEAFCAGAGLDPSSFVGEEPEQVMRRVGGIYKQMVLGLSDLLSERQIVKADLNIDRTTVSASGNNPFKWAPTRRVAIDLLRERKDGFLSGAAALKASFEDMKKHTLCLMGGSRAAVDHVLHTLAPHSIENQMTSQGGLVRINRFESYWRAYENAHAHLADEEPSSAQCSANRAFKAGYERRLRDLEEGGTKS